MVPCNQKDHPWQWWTSKCLTTRSTEGREALMCAIGWFLWFESHTMIFFKLPTCHRQPCKILNTLTIGSREPCQPALPLTSTEPLTIALQPGTLGTMSLLHRGPWLIIEPPSRGLNLHFYEGLISEHMLFRNTDHLWEIWHRGKLAHMWREKVPWVKKSVSNMVRYLVLTPVLIGGSQG